MPDADGKFKGPGEWHAQATKAQKAAGRPAEVDARPKGKGKRKGKK